MKTLMFSTIAAAVIALSAGTAFAGPNSTDNGFQIYLESLTQPHRVPASVPHRVLVSVPAKAPAAERQFLAGPRGDAADYGQGTSNNAKDSAAFRGVQTWGR